MNQGREDMRCILCRGQEDKQELYLTGRAFPGSDVNTNISTAIDAYQFLHNRTFFLFCFL